MLFSGADRQQLMQIQKRIEDQLKRDTANANKDDKDDEKHGAGDDQEKKSLLMNDTRLNFLFYPRHGQWGLLPPHLQQTIEHSSVDEVPLHYRRWLVEYHRQNQADIADK